VGGLLKLIVTVEFHPDDLVSPGEALLAVTWEIDKLGDAAYSTGLVKDFTAFWEEVDE
jgi:hypothetical protein